MAAFQTQPAAQTDTSKKFVTLPGLMNPAMGDGADTSISTGPGISYDPASLAKGPDGRWYALNSAGELAYLPTGLFGYDSSKFVPGANAAQTLALGAQMKARQDQSGNFSDLQDLGTAFKEALPGIAAVASAGALGGAFGELGGLGSLLSSTAPGAASDAGLLTAANASGQGLALSDVVGSSAIPAVADAAAPGVASDLGLQTAADASAQGAVTDTLGSGVVNPETLGSTTGGIASGSINPETFGAGSGFTDLVNTSVPGASLANAGTGGGVADFVSNQGGTFGASFTAPGTALSNVAPGVATAADPLSAAGLKDFLGANKNLIVPGLALGASILAKPKATAAQEDLQNLAGTAGAAANSLIPTVSTGNLPAGAQNQVNTAVEDAKTSIRSKYANMGLSGSTMEAQDLAAADQRGEVMRFELANQLTLTGLQAAGIASGDFAALMNVQLQQDQALQNALANFASSAALGSGLSAIAASKTAVG